jgi:hypothetical protein
MKAVVVEIHKNYCIALTKDGRFIKRKMDGFLMEIGDELELAESFVQQRSARLLRIALVAASVFIVISLSAIFSIQYVRSFLTPDAVTMAAAPEMIEEEMALAMPSEAEVLRDGQEQLMDAKDISSAFIAIEEGPAEYFIDDFHITYEIINGQERSLYVRIENIGENSFTGTVELVFFYDDETVSKTIFFELEDFSYGQYIQEEIAILEEEKSFAFHAYGVFE